MGLFNVNMPLLYGEQHKAFFRLQQEITKISNDQSILAWYCLPEPERYPSVPVMLPRHALSPCPEAFPF